MRANSRNHALGLKNNKQLINKQKNMDSYNSPSTKPLYRGTQIIWYLLGLLEALLAFRFVLKLLAANSDFS